jgi:hypothetical protein
MNCYLTLLKYCLVSLMFKKAVKVVTEKVKCIK